MASSDTGADGGGSEILTQIRDGIGYLTLHRPSRRNAMTVTMQRGIVEQLRSWDRDPGVRIVVLQGAGGHFCAGADLGRFEDSRGGVEKYLEREVNVDLYESFTRLGKPIVAAVEGSCLAGGLGLALSCDVVLASQDASFGLPEIRSAVWPMMVMAIVFRNIGRKKGMDLMLTGRSVGSVEAEAIGLVSRVLAKTDFATEVHAYATALAGHSAIIHRLGRRAFYETCDMEFGKALEFLRGQITILSLTEDSQEGPRAFREKRTPRFRDR